MRIKILGDTDQARGKSFELLIKSLLDQLGYTDFKPNIRPAAMELDIEATHKTENIKILCECKGYKDPVGSAHVVTFNGKLGYEIGKNNADKGYFFSTSGFTSNVDRWYRDSGESTKQILFLNGAKEIVDLLQVSNMLANEKLLNEAVKKNTSYELGERYLVAFQSNLYIVQLLILEEKITSYMILTGKGNVVPVLIMDLISELDDELTSYSRLSPLVTKKVTSVLLDLKQYTVNDIAKITGESIKDILVALGDLQIQKIVINDESDSPNKFTINREISTLSTLTERFVTGDSRFEFMSSAYLELMINNKFADFVMDRFKIPDISNIKEALVKSAKIFPSVLQLLLLGDNQSYLHFYESFQKFTTHPDKEEIQNIIISSFFNEIYQEILHDLRMAPSSYLASKDILGYAHKFQINFGSELKLILGIHGETNMYIANKKVGDAVKAGEIMAPTDLGSNVRLGNNLLSIGEYSSAIKTFDVIIKNSTDNELTSIAWNNKAQCYRMLSRHREELNCINMALKYKKDATYLSNKILCLESLGRKKEIETVKKQLTKLRETNN